MNWENVKNIKLVVYSTAWCGDCKRLKTIFANHDVKYEEIDIDKNPQAANELKMATGKTAIPYIKLTNGKFIRGWHSEAPAAWDESIFFKELSENLK